MDAAVRRWSRRATLLAALGLAGCDLVWPFENNTDLPILLDDPMADKDLLGMVLVEESQVGRRVTHMSESDAHVRRVFRVDPARGVEAVKSLAELATDAGWESRDDPRFPNPRRWLGEKRDPYRVCNILLSDDHVDELVVHLELPQ